MLVAEEFGKLYIYIYIYNKHTVIKSHKWFMTDVVEVHTFKKEKKSLPISKLFLVDVQYQEYPIHRSQN